MYVIASIFMYLFVGAVASLLAAAAPQRVAARQRALSSVLQSGSSLRAAHTPRAARVAAATPARTEWYIGDFVAIALLVAFSGLRFQVGTDYWMYDRNFQDAYTEDWGWALEISRQEYGYTLLELIIRSNTDWRQAMMFVTSAVTVIPMYWMIKKYSPRPGLSVFFYFFLAFYLIPFNIVRQGIAIALNFAAGCLLERGGTRGYSYFVVLNALAAAFHTSVIAVAVIQLATHRMRMTTVRFCIIMGAGVLVALAFSTLSVIQDLVTDLNPRYDQYLLADEAGIGTYLLISAHVALVLICLRIGNMDALTMKYVTWSAIGILFLIVGTQSVVFSRLEFYFATFLIIAVPIQLSKLRRAPQNLLGMPDLQAIIMGGAVVYTLFYLTNYANLLPYNWRVF